MKFATCLIYLAVTGLFSFFAGRILPKKWFKGDGVLFRSRTFERGGRLYDRIYIRKWKDIVPDMSKIVPALIPSKSPGIERKTPEEIELNIQETCIAELIHMLLVIAGFACVFIWPGIGGVSLAVVYALGNIPFVLIQRYNRPRFMKIYAGLKKSTENKREKRYERENS